KYQHSYEFMWREAKEALVAKWKIASEDEEQHQFVTEWDTRLAPMTAMGKRSRLTVKVTGDVVAAYKVAPTHASEMNTNGRTPLSMEDASWSAVENDGGLAMQYLVDLDHRINPPKPWQESERR